MPLQQAWSSKVVGTLTGLLALALTGCEPGLGTVTGKVTCNNRPLPSGSVTFFNLGNVAVSAPIQLDGGYRAKGVPFGTGQVTVVTPLPVSHLSAPPRNVPP